MIAKFGIYPGIILLTSVMTIEDIYVTAGTDKSYFGCFDVGT